MPLHISLAHDWKLKTKNVKPNHSASNIHALGGQQRGETRWLSGQPMPKEHQSALNSPMEVSLGPKWSSLLISCLPDADHVVSGIGAAAGGWGWEANRNWPTVFSLLSFPRLCYWFPRVVPGKFQERINPLSKFSPQLSDGINLKCMDLTCSYH